MKLLKLKIENFECFLDQVEFEFGSGLNIINAENGGGKTKLLDSINWVISNLIYDTQTSEWINADKVSVCPLFYSKNDTENGAEITTSVCLEFEAPDIDSQDYLRNTIWYFEKERIHKKENNQIRIIRNDLVISYKEKTSGQHVAIDTHRNKDILNTLFPPPIRNFMWFQGEVFRDVDISDSNTQFSNILQTISHLPLYGKMLNRANRALKRKERNVTTRIVELQNTNSKARDAAFNIEGKNQENVSLNDKKRTIEDGLEKEDINISKYEDLLSKMIDYVKLSAELKQSKSDIKNNLEIIENYQQSRAEKLIKQWVVVSAKKRVSDIKEMNSVIKNSLTTYQNNTVIPRHIPGPDFVKKMMEDMKCHICETEIPNKEHRAYKALEERFELYKQGENEKWL
ncbi:AAA family ATPase, partial [bacterium]|nr:AAA family ATPase [bacterium]